MAKQKRGHSKDQRRDPQDLLQEAMRLPGVKEVMQVYGEWQTIEEVTRAHRQVMAPKRVVSVSNHSEPLTTGKS